MRRWSSAGLVLLLAVPAAGAARERRGPVYDPEVALMAITVQRASVDLLGQELLRQSEWLDLGHLAVIFRSRGRLFSKSVASRLTVESDILGEYRREAVDFDPASAASIDRLVAELRAYHDLKPGPPLTPARFDGSDRGPDLLEEDGPGADATEPLRGSPLLDEPVAYAERRFGATGPFLRTRRWALDFYLGDFSDLASMYRELGYRRFYRMRAPYATYGRQAFVLSPEPGLRPRLVYCAFQGEDLFVHVRAQWAALTEQFHGRGPVVRTLTCPSCSWAPGGVAPLRALLAEIPARPTAVVYGFDYLLSAAWKDRLLGRWENDRWRVALYKTPDGPAALLSPKGIVYGEIVAAALDEFVRRGARKVFVGLPVAAADPALEQDRLVVPSWFRAWEAEPMKILNSLPVPRRAHKTPGTIAGLPSPLFATREWLGRARELGVWAFDTELSRVAAAALRWEARPNPPEVGLAAVLAGLSALHPEEDRSLYTADVTRSLGREEAKKQWVEAVSAGLGIK